MECYIIIYDLAASNEWYVLHLTKGKTNCCFDCMTMNTLLFPDIVFLLKGHVDPTFWNSSLCLSSKGVVSKLSCSHTSRCLGKALNLFSK